MGRPPPLDVGGGVDLTPAALATTGRVGGRGRAEREHGVQSAVALGGHRRLEATPAWPGAWTRCAIAALGNDSIYGEASRNRQTDKLSWSGVALGGLPVVTSAAGSGNAERTNDKQTGAARPGTPGMPFAGRRPHPAFPWTCAGYTCDTCGTCAQYTCDTCARYR